MHNSDEHAAAEPAPNRPARFGLIALFVVSVLASPPLVCASMISAYADSGGDGNLPLAALLLVLAILVGVAGPFLLLRRLRLNGVGARLLVVGAATLGSIIAWIVATPLWRR